MSSGFFLPLLSALAITGIATYGVPSSSNGRIATAEHTAIAEGLSVAVPGDTSEGSTCGDRPSINAASAGNCTYYSDATHTHVVGEYGRDCCNNYIHWGTKTAFHQCSNACLPCQPPPP